MQNDSLIERLIDLAIEEDISTGDITTNAIIPSHSKATAEMKAKARRNYFRVGDSPKGIRTI